MDFPIFAVGLMSGTSADGVDAALVQTDGAQLYQFVEAVGIAYPPELRKRLLAAAQHDVPLIEVLALEAELTELHAEAVDRLLKNHSQLRVEVIGFHGHTLRHLPERSFTWQIGDASRLTEAVGLPVVADFRRRDMAAGGQGAPLAPLFHAMLWAADPKPLAVLNLGGVANLTWLSADGEVYAGDTGPGCGLLDAWALRFKGEAYDVDGGLASAGTVDEHVVDRVLRLPFFRKSFPRSADRYDFDPLELTHLSPQDGAATLCAVTVQAVRRAAAQFREPFRALWVTGGGARHPVLMRMLSDSFQNVQNAAARGLRPDSLEAECFAWLAVRRLRGLPTSLPTTTGCRQATCGGVVTAVSSRCNDHSTSTRRDDDGD